ncbi:MAG: hypothetical protein L6416_00225 [Candidatus Omnitrophica bacterium]|nr:hypothetical protein [Candidatus Omnitrophota bacterium]
MLKNPIFAKLLVLIIILLIIFISLEIICKAIEHKYFFNTSVYVQQSKPFLHKISDIPGLSYELIARAKDENGFYSINSKGIRDREFKIPKPEGIFRIIVLGDSVTFGTEYPVELTYPKILEKLLNKKPGPNIRFEVMNAGVCSYNAVQKFLFLKNKLLDYEPDIVILQFLNDDYYRNAVVLSGDNNSKQKDVFISMGEYFSSNFPKLLVLPYSLDRLLMRHLALYRVMNKRIYDRLSMDDPKRFPSQAYRFAAYADMGESMRVNKAVFESLYELSEKCKFKIFLLLVPELKNESRIDGWIKNDCPHKYGFSSIDLQKAFKAKGVHLEDLRIVPDGTCHLNDLGHRITAGIIKERLDKYFSN